MSRELCMGNQALAFGALKAGVNVAAGYPGTPSSEILETLAAQVASRGLDRDLDRDHNLHVEWSTNEKAALEVGLGASLAGARALVTMKQVGLNVAADPLMSLPYLGTRGGLVLVVADDPGPISSQTEQDTRQFAGFAKVPALDPSTPEEAYLMIQSAFDLSERYGTPVILRPSTRICHGSAPVETSYDYQPHAIEGFTRSPRWVIFPQRSYQGHLELLDRLPRIAQEFTTSPFNTLVNTHATAPAHQGIMAGGISYAYLHDALMQLDDLPSLRLFKCGTPFPFPEALALEFLTGLKEVLVFEELEPVLERELLQLIGKHGLKVKVYGKLSGHTTQAGENSVAQIAQQINSLYGDNDFPKPLDVTPLGARGSLGSQDAASSGAASAGAAPTPSAASAGPGAISLPPLPPLPPRPPVLCAGCPHRASFYAVKQALKGRPAVFSGDIGCYTLGNALPLDMVDTCVCMGAGFTVPQGIHWAQPQAVHLGFVGDSTFFASGLTGVVNAVYNQSNVTLCVLDNDTTAMTGGQPHPGTGVPITTANAPKDADKPKSNPPVTVDIPGVLKALGVQHVTQVDPFDQPATIAAVQAAVDYNGVSALVFNAPCITEAPAQPQPTINPGLCTFCMKCIQEIGCPALMATPAKKVTIDTALCWGCDLCVGLCSTHAIQPAAGKAEHAAQPVAGAAGHTTKHSTYGGHASKHSAYGASHTANHAAQPSAGSPSAGSPSADSPSADSPSAGGDGLPTAQSEADGEPHE